MFAWCLKKKKTCTCVQFFAGNRLVMEPAKIIGKLKEQVRMEHNSRRNFPQVWAQISDKQTNKFYHQNEINSQLSDQLQLKDLCSFLHNNQGESQFVSPEMYKNLLAVCRCGRARQNHHMGKCLQRALSPDCERSKIQGSPHDSCPQPLSVPRTSNSSIGFVGTSKSYQKLERSMQYVSPAYSMRGPRITAVPYNHIIIG
ncbi:uncharacterized protein LOC108029633 isoform X1 [Drosophila biarmipes]|uniref:uncharacterized protein LOC108029633 isoform X1 n=1 Tax=Drosophila biarmipes TaxID=125945 RepID=UPI0021CCF3CA|nr:uncharacterized protein LOC108029633 isoform X1 [Drosophila biarmipes]